jgi:hypothetical protein
MPFVMKKNDKGVSTKVYVSKIVKQEAPFGAKKVYVTDPTGTRGIILSESQSRTSMPSVPFGPKPQPGAPLPQLNLPGEAAMDVKVKKAIKTAVNLPGKVLARALKVDKVTQAERAAGLEPAPLWVPDYAREARLYRTGSEEQIKRQQEARLARQMQEQAMMQRAEAAQLIPSTPTISVIPSDRPSLIRGQPSQEERMQWLERQKLLDQQREGFTKLPPKEKIRLIKERESKIKAESEAKEKVEKELTKQQKTEQIKTEFYKTEAKRLSLTPEAYQTDEYGPVTAGVREQPSVEERQRFLSALQPKTEAQLVAGVKSEKARRAEAIKEREIESRIKAGEQRNKAEVRELQIKEQEKQARIQKEEAETQLAKAKAEETKSKIISPEERKQLALQQTKITAETDIEYRKEQAAKREAERKAKETEQKAQTDWIKELEGQTKEAYKARIEKEQEEMTPKLKGKSYVEQSEEYQKKADILRQKAETSRVKEEGKIKQEYYQSASRWLKERAPDIDEKWTSAGKKKQLIRDMVQLKQEGKITSWDDIGVDSFGTDKSAYDSFIDNNPEGY